MSETKFLFVATNLTEDTKMALFNGHFPGQPGYVGTRMSPFWILLELSMMEVVVTTGAIRRAKLQTKCHHQ